MNIHTSQEIISLLCNPDTDRFCLTDNLDLIIDECINIANSKDNEQEANCLWVCKTIANIQRSFIVAFESIKSENHYEAWCILERCEIEIDSLSKHHHYKDNDCHSIGFISEMIKHWQSLYPYKLFFSPEILEKKVSCSICNKVITPRSNCGHILGNIYHGKMCCINVIEMEFISISAVEDPVQKYSVAFLCDPDTNEKIDHYDYSNIKFVADRVSSPFHGWKPEATTRIIDITEVSHINPLVMCPCFSGKAFGECCYNKTTLVVPHLQIQLSVKPEDYLPELIPLPTTI